MRVSARRLAVATARTPSQIRVSGNQASHGTRIPRSIIEVVEGGAVSLVCSDNQCTLSASGGMDQVVLLGAQRITANANTIVHNVDSLSLHLLTGNGPAAPIGNITSAGILLNGSSLPPPFDALNPTG